MEKSQNNHFLNSQTKKRRVFLYGAGVVAPGAQDTGEFLELVRNGKSALTPKESMYNAFLSGEPKFDFSFYKNWIEERHGPKRYSALNEKSGDLIKFSMGTLIQAVSSHPELEKVIAELNPRLSIRYATGLADLPVITASARQLDKAEMIWNRFWANPQRNNALEKHQQGISVDPKAPADPCNFDVDSPERIEAVLAWNAYWAPQSYQLQEYLINLEKLEEEGIKSGDIEHEKLNLIRQKMKQRKLLQEKYGFPPPPWECVSPNLLWNIPNLPAAQASMILGLHGSALGISGACGSFGALIEGALSDINSGKVDLVIVGSVDASPSKELISAFYSGRLAVMGKRVGVPLCDLRGTHLSGGACTWILAADDVMNKFNIPHMGVEILGAGVSSDAEHIITPSKEGPKLAISKAFSEANISSHDIKHWDLHATGTPGDLNELVLIEDFVPKEAYISARKGLFGHGMAASGGWELTAQVLAPVRDNDFILLPQSGINPVEINPQIKKLHRLFLCDEAVPIKRNEAGIIGGKMSLGVGGISSCVITRIV